MKDTRMNDKKLDIYFQDMSKAYDRINLPILKKAMLRLRILKALIKVILSLFQERETAVITHNGFSDPYKVTIGIDQGEIISPLLWVIYYDPLLTSLQSMDSDYLMFAEVIKDISEPL